MIVKDELTKQEALKLQQENGLVYYSDRYMFSSVVTSPKTLGIRIDSALSAGEIAIVALEQTTMEYFDWELKRYKQELYKQEQKMAHAYFKSHPEQAIRMMVK